MGQRQKRDNCHHCQPLALAHTGCWDSALCTEGLSFPSFSLFAQRSFQHLKCFTMASCLPQLGFQWLPLCPGTVPPLGWALPISQESPAGRGGRQEETGRFLAWLLRAAERGYCADTAPSTTEGFRHISKHCQPHVSAGGARHRAGILGFWSG